MLITDIKSKRGWMSAFGHLIPAGAFLRCSDLGGGEYIGTWPADNTTVCDCSHCMVWTGCDVSDCGETSPHKHNSPTRYTLYREFPAPRPLGMPAISNLRRDGPGQFSATLLPSSAPSPSFGWSEEALARGLFRVRMRDLIELRGEAAHCHKAYEWPQRIRAEAVLWEKESSAAVRGECEAEAKALVEEMERWQHVVSANGLIASQRSTVMTLERSIRELGRTVARVEFDDDDEYDEFADDDGERSS